MCCDRHCTHAIWRGNHVATAICLVAFLTWILQSRWFKIWSTSNHSSPFTTVGMGGGCTLAPRTYGLRRDAWKTSCTLMLSGRSSLNDTGSEYPGSPSRGLWWLAWARMVKGPNHFGSSFGVPVCLILIFLELRRTSSPMLKGARRRPLSACFFCLCYAVCKCCLASTMSCCIPSAKDGAAGTFGGSLKLLRRRARGRP